MASVETNFQWKRAFTERKEINLDCLRDQRQPMQNPDPDQPRRGAQAQQASAYSRKERNLDLYGTLGTEGQRLFGATPDSEDYDRDHNAVLTIYDGLFQTPVNLIIVVRNFQIRAQKPQESVNDFVTELQI
ncbi:MAG: hypothetical protein GY696_06735 [Gammaproteobacteria bacterium]|nr:hypothetical protein [Gammaproteobacteria bacterium]